MRHRDSGLTLGCSLAVLLFSSIVACSSAKSESVVRREPLIGVKIYEHEGGFIDLFAEWRSLRINTAFVSESLASDPSFTEQARNQDIAIFVIAPVFFNPEALAEDPDLYALTADGTRAEKDWVQFVCPSRPRFRQKRVGELAELVRRIRPQGLSLDFIRHFVYWEMVHPETSPESLPNTCFCPHCVARFGEEMDIEVPAGLSDTRDVAVWILTHHEKQWTEWKGRLITSMVVEIVQAARAVAPELRISLHAVPWRREDYAEAIARIAGQDFASLSGLVDYLSPMCYSFMLQRRPEWIHSVVKDLSATATAKVIPSIQVREHYRAEERFGVEEFELCLREALKPPSEGVVFWSWDGLAQEPEKRRVVREVLSGLQP